MSRTRELVDFATDAVFAIDRGMRVVGWNDYGPAFLGFEPGEVIGRPCYDILRALRPDGVPQCIPTCKGDLCFGRSRVPTAPWYLLHHKNGWQVPATIRPLLAISEHNGTNSGDSEVTVVVLAPRDTPRLLGPPSQKLRISTFGRFSLSTQGCDLDIERWRRKKAITLLKYLALHLGRAIHRERLIEILWPGVDYKRGWDRLKVTISFLRHQLRAAGTGMEVLVTANEAYVLSREAVWLDTDVFEQLVSQANDLQSCQRWDDSLRCYEEAKGLYRADFMEEDIYVEWCADERARLREIYLEMLAGMVESYAKLGRYDKSAQTCQTALAQEPCGEFFHRALMKWFVRLGRHDRALVQYKSCESILARELGTAPMPETCRLYRRILAGEDAAVDPAAI